ncbi:hypothetical protein LTS08_005634 [Lithohypha guttulata]|uniref:uncharacterized protein n=1 Tax=Lithohypha guttulata TaxID=1690604 RepID=UPI002DE1609C|nr:hypothetical protein LTR51_003196 [Lithohypha guttulata]KAK5099919.1 hypothetical protein LTS08_005634 [Lithohypha guttulata]
MAPNKYQQHPPFSPNAKLLQRFYAPLILLSVYDPTRGRTNEETLDDVVTDQLTELWHKFLDSILLLCDFEKGGDTVAAIGAQTTPESPIYWLASNSGKVKRSREHLVWIFEQLNRMCADEGISYKVQEGIVKESISFCSKRINDQSRWLSKDIQHARQAAGASTTNEEVRLLESLVQFTSLAGLGDNHCLCLFAYKFRKTSEMKWLTEKHHANPGSIWSSIRHHIGRLGVWEKAAAVLVRGTKRFPQRVEKASIELVTPAPYVDLPCRDDEQIPSLDRVMKTMFDANNRNVARQLNDALEETNIVAEIKAPFRQRYTQFDPRPHAELLVLEHFNTKKLEFVADDPYIGCSKPSCYCCDLYMRCHPMKLARRPTHGNLWINWAPPMPLQPSERKAITGVRPQEHHTFIILQNMLTEIRRDLRKQIESRRPRGRRLPDSTTGMMSTQEGSQLILDKVVGEMLNLSVIRDVPKHSELYSRSQVPPEGNGPDSIAQVLIAQSAGTAMKSKLPNDEVPEHRASHLLHVFTTSRQSDLRRTGLPIRQQNDLLDQSQHKDGQSDDVVVFGGRRIRST